MPRRDGTGPIGHGPLSGRGLGYCTYLGRRLGLGRGYGRRYLYSNSPEAEKELLQEQINVLKERLEFLERGNE